jgi:prephenate dehydrogenase
MIMAEAVAQVAAAHEAAAASSSNAAGPKGTASGTYSSIGQLRQENPELYKALLQGLTMGAITQIQHNQAHLKEVQREARREAERH